MVSGGGGTSPALTDKAQLEALIISWQIYAISIPDIEHTILVDTDNTDIEYQILNITNKPSTLCLIKWYILKEYLLINFMPTKIENYFTSKVKVSEVYG